MMGTIEVQFTGMHIVEEPALTGFFLTTRTDTGIYGDSEGAMRGLPNELTADNGIWIRYGPHRLYEGWLLPPQQTFTDDERWYIPAGSYIERGKRNEVFGRVWQDSDVSQWFAFDDIPSWASCTNSGDKFRILNTAGNVDPGDSVIYPVVVYWLTSGLRTDIHIDSLSFTATKIGTPQYDLIVATWSVPPIPSASKTTELTVVPATASPYDKVTSPLAISHATTAKQAIAFCVKSAVGHTATIDNGWDITNLKVSCGTTAGGTFTMNVGEALANLAQEVGVTSGNALHTYSDTSVSTLVARPTTTVSAAQESIVGLAALQLKWGYEVGGVFDSAAVGVPDPASKGDRARWWSITHADCTFTSDVISDGEGFYDYVAVLYGAIGVSGVKDGMPRVAYRPGTPASALSRVKVLDYSGRYMTTAEANAVGDQWLLWRGPTAGSRGTIVVYGDIRDVDGHVRPAIVMRPGDWIEERDRRGHAPWLITGVAYNTSGVVQISVGGTERVFSVVAPGLGGIYTDEVLGTWTPEAASTGTTASAALVTDAGQGDRIGGTGWYVAPDPTGKTTGTWVYGMDPNIREQAWWQVAPYIPE